MLKQSVFILLAVSLLSAAVTETRKPPTPTMKDLNHRKAGCKVPEFLVSVPPMMEKDYVECVNTRSRPSDMLAKAVLRRYVSEEAVFVGIEPAPRFYTRVFKVTYKIGGDTKAMICNEKMTYCLDDKPIVSRER
jgi:hypothetical protein